MSLTTSINAYYKLDESSGNATDSVNSNTATNTNSATFATGLIHNGADLESGSSQYFSAADHATLDITGDLTISAWIKLESDTATFQTIASKWTTGQQSWLLRYRISDTSLYFNSSSDGTNSTAVSVSYTLNTGTWYHVVAVYTASAGSLKFYVDGSQRGTTQTGLHTSLFNSSAPLRIGANDSAATQFLDGMIDEVGLWSRVLTDGEIGTDAVNLYRGGIGLQYPFNQSVLSTETVTMTDTPSYVYVRQRTATDTVTATDTATTRFGWSNQTKSSSTWTNQTKS